MSNCQRERDVAPTRSDTTEKVIHATEVMCFIANSRYYGSHSGECPCVREVAGKVVGRSLQFRKLGKDALWEARGMRRIMRRHQTVMPKIEGVNGGMANEESFQWLSEESTVCYGKMLQVRQIKLCRKRRPLLSIEDILERQGRNRRLVERALIEGAEETGECLNATSDKAWGGFRWFEEIPEPC